MKKLTKLQRYTAYCCMLAEFDSFYNSCNFFCTAAMIIGIGGGLDDGVIEKYFPELWEHKPPQYFTAKCWFSYDDTDKRIAILKQCIEETHPDNPLNSPE